MLEVIIINKNEETNTFLIDTLFFLPLKIFFNLLLNSFLYNIYLQPYKGVEEDRSFQKKFKELLVYIY